MKRSILISIILLLCLAFTCTPSAIRRVLNGPNGAVLTDKSKTQKTKEGATVYSHSGISDSQLSAIDAGLSRAFGNAKLSSYFDERSNQYSFYDIFIPPYSCTPSPIQRIPSFILHADQYDGTIYDQYNPKGKETDATAIAQGFVNKRDGKGVIYAAEMVLSLGTPESQPARGQMYICPDSATEPANNGAEHILIANNDPDYYWATQFHALGGHPLLPHNVQSSLSVRFNRPATKDGSVNGNLVIDPVQ
jgi:hypothetical protein